MKDIEILEEFIEDYRNAEEFTTGEVIYAIENIIARNKDLEEKNKLLIEGKFREVADKNSYIKDNYISKQKVKEKIKEYDKMILATYEEPTHQADIRRDNCIEIKAQLNELLQ